MDVSAGPSEKRARGRAGVAYTRLRVSAAERKRGRDDDDVGIYGEGLGDGAAGLEWGAAGFMGDAFGVVKRDVVYPSDTSVREILNGVLGSSVHL